MLLFFVSLVVIREEGNKLLALWDMSTIYGYRETIKLLVGKQRSGMEWNSQSNTVNLWNTKYKFIQIKRKWTTNWITSLNFL